MEQEITVTPTQETENPNLSIVLAGLCFESPEAKTLRKDLDAAKVKVAELSEKFSAIDKHDNSQKNSATRLAKKLLKDGLSVEAVTALLQTQYGRTRKSSSVGDMRKSHKLEQDIQEKILGFVAGHADGISAREIWGAFADADKLGVSIIVKQLVKEGKITAVGNTRQRKYFPVG